MEISGLDLEVRQNELVRLSNGEVVTIGEMARWELLIESFDLIVQHGKDMEKEISIEEIAKSIPMHKAINQYIKERYWAQVCDIITELNW